MARRSSKFSSLPNNSPARKRIYRNARLGARPQPRQYNLGDAFRVVSSVGKYKEWFETEQANIDFLRVLNDSWVARKDWRP